ncbi:MAG: ABC transporter substrate-binding protein [Egibacteraceae bacterium]
MARSLAAVVCALTLLVAACGDAAPTQPSGTALPPDAPARIVSLSPTTTEMLFAIGAGEQVVAVDLNSDYPQQVETLPNDLSGFEPNVEAIAAYGPDLVVITNDLGDVQAGLEALDVEVLLLEAASKLDDSYAQIAELGVATGHQDQATALVTRMRTDIEQLTASAPDHPVPVTFFHELDDTLYTATSRTFIGQIYQLAGLHNIADEADIGDDSDGYLQLSAEFVVQADPDFIFLADSECCGQSLETLAQRPGFGGLTAVRNNQVVVLSEDLSSRWGPRVVDFLRVVMNATAAESVR